MVPILCWSASDFAPMLTDLAISTGSSDILVEGQQLAWWGMDPKARADDRKQQRISKCKTLVKGPAWSPQVLSVRKTIAFPAHSKEESVLPGSSLQVCLHKGPAFLFANR